jgi:hypothetical protein
MTRVTWTITLCFAALALGAGSAGAAAGLPSGGLPVLPTVLAPADQAVEDDSATDDQDESEDADAADDVEPEELEPAEDDDSTTSSSDVVDVSAAYIGSHRLRGLRKMTYLATCPEADCELSLDVELRFPGGKRVLLEAQAKKLDAGRLERLSVKVPRVIRKWLKRVARADQKVLAVATINSWVGLEMTAREPIRTRLR